MENIRCTVERITYQNEENELDELALAYATTNHKSQENLRAHRTSKSFVLCGEEPYRGAKKYKAEGKAENKSFLSDDMIILKILWERLHVIS